ncbi:MAG: helix-turn-helix transcriptional regulator [Bacteroidetes bacterium]|nr:helix-turn-helix transcriptional regulator [Bacteroidota bacterium]
MIDRIGRILKTQKISASMFADEIGVQRSSVSHVMSGRNKPSLDFITRIVNRYPEIDSVWLLTGKGEMLREMNDGDKPDDLVERQEGVDDIDSSSFDMAEGWSGKEKKYENQPIIKAKKGRGLRSSDAKQVSRIVIFYPDGTFEEYLPGK